jgi:hypothetical protein
MTSIRLPVFAVLAAFLALGALSACTTATALSDAQSVLSSVQTVAPQIEAIYGVSSTQAATVASAISAAQEALAEATTAADATTEAEKLQVFETAVNQVITIAEASPLVSPQVKLVIAAIQVLLPVIETEITANTAPAVGVTSNSLAVAQARAVLNAQ